MLEATFPGMGSTIHVALSGGRDADVDFARGRLAQLEALWSRFRADSELSRLNEAGELEVSVETRDAVLMALRAWRLTHGIFDPTVHDAVVAAGYDRTFADVRRRATFAPAEASVVGCDDVVVEGDLVRLPRGVRLDLGGIGKGRAADLVAVELLGRGVAGACVNVGGDVRVAGEPPDSSGAWAVDVESPSGGPARGALVALGEGAVATSTTLKRTWQTTNGSAHHLIDPRTGRPGDTDVVTATVIAAEAAWAEIFAKSIVLGGTRRGVDLVGEHSLAAMVTRRNGVTIRTHSFERYEPWTAISGGILPVPVA